MLKPADLYRYSVNWYNVFNHDNRTDVKDMIHFVETELRNAEAHGEKVNYN